MAVTIPDYAAADAYTPGDKRDHKSGVFKVVLRKPGQRITVLWNQDGANAPPSSWSSRCNEGPWYGMHAATR